MSREGDYPGGMGASRVAYGPGYWIGTHACFWHASVLFVNPSVGQYSLAARALGRGWGVGFEVGRGTAMSPGWR